MLDSLNFFLQPLDKLPKSIRIRCFTKKGDFPHMFNLNSNYDYVGKIPSIDFFSIDEMKPDKANKIKEWHKSQSNVTNWNFKK